MTFSLLYCRPATLLDNQTRHLSMLLLLQILLDALMSQYVVSQSVVQDVGTMLVSQATLSFSVLQSQQLRSLLS